MTTGCPLAQSSEAGSFKGRDVDENILPAIQRNKAVALRGIEPFHGTGLLDRHLGGWLVGGCRVKIRFPSSWWSGGAGIDGQYVGDVWPRVTWADKHFEGFARLNSVDTTLSKNAAVKEGIARSI